jgi:hypothetical protein
MLYDSLLVIRLNLHFKLVPVMDLQKLNHPAGAYSNDGEGNIPGGV